MVTIDWANKIIQIPKSYFTLLSGTLYELDTNQLRLDLKGLEGSEPGMPFEDTHRHNTEVTIAGIVYARTFEIINGYTVTLEDGLYAVNGVGSNNNMLDVINRNQVGYGSTNSAGLISGNAINTTLDELIKYERNRWLIDNNQLTIYDDDGVTPLRTFDLKDNNGDPTEASPFERIPT